MNWIQFTIGAGVVLVTGIAALGLYARWLFSGYDAHGNQIESEEE